VYHSAADGTILFLHTAFRFNGLAGVTTLMTLIVVASGVLGRYIYTAIPRTAIPRTSDGIEMQTEEVERAITEAEGELRRLLQTRPQVATFFSEGWLWRRRQAGGHWRLTWTGRGPGANGCAANRVAGTPTQCGACHQKNDAHGGKFGSDCGACHSTSAWTPANFDHNRSGFPLTGASSCHSCHPSNLNTWTCASFHSDSAMASRHSGARGFSSNCIACHPTGSSEGGGGRGGTGRPRSQPPAGARAKPASRSQETSRTWKPNT